MYLCHEEDKLFADDADAAVALEALATFEPKMAKQWRTILDADSSALDGLTADMFDECLEDSPVTCENVARLVKAGSHAGSQMLGLGLGSYCRSDPDCVCLLRVRARVGIGVGIRVRVRVTIRIRVRIRVRVRAP